MRTLRILQTLRALRSTHSTHSFAHTIELVTKMCTLRIFKLYALCVLYPLCEFYAPCAINHTLSMSFAYTIQLYYAHLAY